MYGFVNGASTASAVWASGTGPQPPSANRLGGDSFSCNPMFYLSMSGEAVITFNPVIWSSKGLH